MAKRRIRKNTVFSEVYYEEVEKDSSWETVKREKPASPPVREFLERALKMFIGGKLKATEVHNRVSCFHEGVVTASERQLDAKTKKITYKIRDRDVAVADVVTVKFCPEDPFGEFDHHRIRMFGADGSRADFPLPRGSKVPAGAGEPVEA